MSRPIYTRGPAPYRFQTKYKVDDATGCWEWTSPLGRDGYGTFHEDGRAYPAHRWSYLHFIGPIGEGLHVDHLCKNRRCVNPAHLEAVTPEENARRRRGWRKSHCINGHSMADSYKRTNDKGYVSQVCRTCVKIRNDRRPRKTRAA